jgi:hypothetical protein
MRTAPLPCTWTVAWPGKQDMSQSVWLHTGAGGQSMLVAHQCLAAHRVPAAGWGGSTRLPGMQAACGTSVGQQGCRGTIGRTGHGCNQQGAAPDAHRRTRRWCSKSASAGTCTWRRPLCRVGSSPCRRSGRRGSRCRRGRGSRRRQSRNQRRPPGTSTRPGHRSSHSRTRGMAGCARRCLCSPRRTSHIQHPGCLVCTLQGGHSMSAAHQCLQWMFGQ